MIAIDWGSSSLRAFRLDARGAVLETRRAPLGVLACAGRFEQVLQEQIGDWDDDLIVLAGMIGSRQGWIEVPYVNCPATLQHIAANMVNINAPNLPGHRVWIVPGLQYRSGSHVDLLRGEETQLCGLMMQLDTERHTGRHIACLPGTHSKWAVIEGGRIESFFTAMTGEVFDVLCHHSLLGRLMMASDAPLDRAAFLQGMARAQQPGGLLHHLFSVRTVGLRGTFNAVQLPSYLSGLLIAHELLDANLTERAHGCGVHLIGSPTLVEAYVLALRQFDVATVSHDETLAAQGLFALARSRDLVGSAP